MAFYKSPTYYSWSKTKERCLNIRHIAYHRYGGRGITACKRWLKSYNVFLEDMGERPKGKSLGRINNSGNYTPRNCRWETPREQHSNTVRSAKLTLNGETKNLKAWAKTIGINYQTIAERLKRGWNICDALTNYKFNSWNGPKQRMRIP